MMKPRTKRIIYFISKGLFSAMMGATVYNYFFDQEWITEAYIGLGYPTHLIYPMGIAKALGLIAIWVKKSDTLKEWAYAGFFYNMALAVMAHYHAGDGKMFLTMVPLILVMTAYALDKNLSAQGAVQGDKMNGSAS